ncbi:flagellar hook-basal body protein [Roseateles chitinivorans]|uniref:flagellar hook-basal body protein n=1 Tax=Roseateles chitinivorans TaxID=2917965 RepID=UPI003D67D1D2
MNDLMLTTLSAMQRDAYRLERVSANMANMLTPGYKRELVVEQLEAAAVPFGQQVADGMAAPVTDEVTVDARRDLKPGPMNRTGRALDLALSGPGFYEVRTPQGPAYTRQASFRIDDRGELVDAAGNALMGANGALTLAPGAVDVAADGTVRQEDRVVGQLRVLVPDAGTRMQALGGGLFVTEGRLSAAAEGAAGVRQGFVEGSNVDTAQEMVQLMGAVRHFESMTRATQMYDDMMGLAVRKLADL